jgi:ribonuclease P protein component
MSLLTPQGHVRTLAALPNRRLLNAQRKTRDQANETYLSAQQLEARPNARVSCTHGDKSRAPRFEAPPREGSREAHPVDPQSNLSRLAGGPQYRLRNNNRLRTAAGFARVFKKATRSRDKWFTVLCRDNDTQVARLGLAISKKHCKTATGRNRIKRIVRESFRNAQHRLAGLDVIVLSQPATAAADNRRLRDSLATHWQRCGHEQGRKGRPRDE